MSRYDTTPSEEDRAHAADVLRRVGSERATRAAVVADLLGWRMAALRDAELEWDARIIARGRALWDAHEETNPS